MCNESITLSLASLSACKTDTFAYSSSSLCSWVATRLNFFLYWSMMSHTFSSILLKCSVKLLLDLWQAFNLSANIVPSTLGWSLSTLRSLSSLLLPHKAPQNLFWPCSSFRVLFVSYSKASVVATLMSQFVALFPDLDGRCLELFLDCLCPFRFAPPHSPQGFHPLPRLKPLALGTNPNLAFEPSATYDSR